MDIQVKELEPCSWNVTCVMDAGEIFKKRGEILDAFKKAPVPGFRQGKASIDAIKMHYNNQINDSLKRSLAEEAFHKAMFEKKFRPFGAPQFNSLLLADGKFTCDFNLRVKPEFELSKYSNLEVPKPHETKDANTLAEEMMQELRIKFGDVTPYTEDDFIEKSDHVILDYESTIDGVKNDNLSATGDMLIVGKNQLAEFDDNILGMKIGETREFDVIGPANGLASIAGKKIHFKVTLTMGSKNIPCALDDTLAHKMEKKDFAELKDFIKNLATSKIEQTLKINITESAVNQILANTKIDVPSWMSLSEAQYLVHSAKLSWDDLVDEDKEQYLSIAEKNVKLALILDRIREVESGAQLTDQEIFEIIKERLSKTKLQASIEDVMKDMTKTGYLQVLFARIKDEYTLDFIVKTVRVQE